MGKLTLIRSNIVRFIDVQEDPLSPLLIMEFLACGNLDQQADFTFSETVAMLGQQLKALAYLHGLGITHRDIKPENILLVSRSPDLITKLSDFGLSSDRDQLKTFCGTKHYLAPEVDRKGSQYTNTVDIWSLGTVGLEFSYGLPVELPRWNARDGQTLYTIMLSGSRGTWQNFCRKCLAYGHVHGLLQIIVCSRWRSGISCSRQHLHRLQQHCSKLKYHQLRSQKTAPRKPGVVEKPVCHRSVL